jgi:LuxR family maltose regulon positive regulatory protein
MPTTILLVDDHPVFRKGLRLLLEEEQDFKVVGEAGDGQEAIDRVREFSPDVIIMDINMPNFNGIDATREIVADFPETKIVTLSIHSGKRFIEDMLSAGAVGYILKECAPEELVKGVRSVMRHEIYLSPSVTEIIVSEFVTPRPITEDTGDYAGWTADETIPIIRTKLHPPPIPENHVHRPQLLKQLENGRQNQLTLVSAPAGYGKSILLSCWLENSDCPNAWFSVDESDNNLRQFLIYFLTAIRTMFPDAVEKTLALANSANLPPMKVLAANLLNELSQIDQDYILAVDDIHLIQEKQVYDLLTKLLQYAPQRMHLVLIGRRDPFLPISSLRAQGLLTEIRLQDLSFSTAETRGYLNQMLGEQIEDATAAEWAEKTEGWIAGLHLAALSMRHRGDAASMPPEMPGGVQYVTEYLFNEVFAHQALGVRHYLLITSILDRFCAPLCDVVCRSDVESGQADISSWDFINLLKKENLFIINLDFENRWFRYHHLFQQLLQNQLNRYHDSKEIAALHSRASEWFESQGLIDEAIRHALAAGNSIGAAEIVERHRHAELDQDRWYVVERWLAMLPDEIKQQRPGLLLTHLFILADQYRLLDMPPIIERVESLLADETADEELVGELNFHQGTVLVWVHCDGERARKRLEAARKRLPEKRGMMNGRLECYLGMACQMMGEGELAIESLEEKIREIDSQEDAFSANLIRGVAFIHLLSGHLDRAVRATQRLTAVAAKSDLDGLEAMSHYMLANARLRSYDLKEALQGFLFATEKRNIVNRRIAVDAMAGLVLTYQAMQHKDEAANALKQLLEFFQETDDPQGVVLAESCQARLSLLLGDLKPAIRWARSFDAEPHVAGTLFWLEIPLITQARVLVAAGTDEDLGKALELLGVLRQQVETPNFTCQTIEIMVLQSMALEKIGNANEALTVLEEVVALAEPRGWVHPFVELGSPMADLLKRLLKQNIAVDYIGKLLAAFGEDETGSPSLPVPLSPSPQVSLSPSHPIPQPLVEPLTNRELDILDLLAQRLQNKEIADKLFISPETVKTHLNNIYQKLSVTNRRNAVEKAKKLVIL